jgi:hypothetical protein
VETKIGVHSLGLDWSSFVKIDDIPSLIGSIVFLPDDNLSSFLIFSSMNIKSSSILDINEMFINILEDLEPSRVGAPDLHVVGSSCTLDIPRLVVQLGLDGQ